MRNKSFLALTLGIAGLGFGLSFAYTWNPAAARSRFAMQWAESFDSLEAMAASADIIAVAKAGPSFHSRTAVSDDGHDQLPFEVVELEVQHGLKGIGDGGLLYVERAGGLAPDGRVVTIEADGGAFEPGSISLLFLKWQPGGTGFAYQINQQARFSVQDGSLLAVDPDDRTATVLHGLPLEEARSRIAALLR